MEEKPCWKFMENASILCTQYESPDILSAMREVKSWMRTPDCASVRQDDDPSEGCCGLGYIDAENVDVYYWPEPDLNTACLSIIGNRVHPLEFRATTSMGLTYWGCTAMNPMTSTTISDMMGQSGEVAFPTTLTIVQFTAQMTTIGPITFKQSLVNPWTPAGCVHETSIRPSSSIAAETHDTQGAIRARGDSLVIPTSVTQAGGLPASTVVSGDFTFTSPSIYANFHSIRANDWCGQLWSKAVVTQTMLTFAPGELSTIAGPLTDALSSLFPGRAFSTKQFNSADLPCPPQSVMEENWYKPKAEEPYRPLIAMPSQITSIDPSYTYCVPFFFTGFDPPQTLIPASAMVSESTASQIIATSRAPTSNATLEVGAMKTEVQNRPSPMPGTIPTAPPPGNTINALLAPHMQRSDFQSQLMPEQQGADPATQVSNFNLQSSLVRDTELAYQVSSSAEAIKVNQMSAGLDVEPISPDQML